MLKINNHFGELTINESWRNEGGYITNLVLDNGKNATISIHLTNEEVGKIINHLNSYIKKDEENV